MSLVYGTQFGSYLVTEPELTVGGNVQLRVGASGRAWVRLAGSRSPP